jgi:hypothetical protein
MVSLVLTILFWWFILAIVAPLLLVGFLGLTTMFQGPPAPPPALPPWPPGWVD